MARREFFDNLRLVASFALVGAVASGSLLTLLPSHPEFDLRYIGAVVGGVLSAIVLFRHHG
jgi:hypothetical protein